MSFESIISWFLGGSIGRSSNIIICPQCSMYTTKLSINISNTKWGRVLHNNKLWPHYISTSRMIEDVSQIVLCLIQLAIKKCPDRRLSSVYEMPTKGSDRFQQLGNLPIQKTGTSANTVTYWMVSVFCQPDNIFEVTRNISERMLFLGFFPAPDSWIDFLSETRLFLNAMKTCINSDRIISIILGNKVDLHKWKLDCTR